ncbi:hypothetical protein [Mesorhizobium sp. M0040]|uniref:hypothetical protein n=1 Tax=Mesorhizobium sp. M0040 TaxID=2956855 RepID=UPI00333BF410
MAENRLSLPKKAGSVHEHLVRVIRRAGAPASMKCLETFWSSLINRGSSLLPDLFRTADSWGQ